MVELFGGAKADIEKVNKLTTTNDVVKLISTDEKIFFVNMDVARQSKKLAQTINDPTNPRNQLLTINLQLDSKTLETVIRYLHFRIINAGLEKKDRVEFNLEPMEALEVLNAAIYLQC